MKILTEEEIQAHTWATTIGGIKGVVSGFLVTGAIFKLGARKFPGFPGNTPWSMRTALFIAPPTVGCTIWAEEASNAFDREMYSSDVESKQRLEEYQKWSKLPLSEKLINGAITHKYKIIVGAWAASMYGSWVYVDRDPIMTKTQKIVQARMYAQSLTVILLLAAMGLSIWDEKAHPEHYVKDKDEEWLKILEEEEAREAEEKAQSTVRKPQRVNIYKN